MRTLRHVGVGLLALTLATGLAACGDDDDSGDAAETTDSTDGEETADNAAFCDAVVEFNTAVFQVELNEESTEDEIIAVGEEIGPVFQTVADEAPDSLSDSAAELNESVQALTEGDAEAFNADDTFEQYTELVAGAVDECDYEAIDVTALDYAYQGLPDTVEAGTVAFNFTNDAESEDHMMAILKKKDGVDLTWDELLALPEDEAEGQTEFRGEAFAPAGATSATLASLDAGEYIAICFIPVGSPDVEDGPPHFTQGMKHEFTVE